MITGSGSLDSCIQGQQIGLAGNTTNFLNKIINFLRSNIQLINISNRSFNYLANTLDGIAYFIN